MKPSPNRDPFFQPDGFPAIAILTVVVIILFICGFSIKKGIEEKRDVWQVSIPTNGFVGIAKFAPVTHYLSNNGTVVAVTETKGIYQAFVRVDGDRDGTPLAFSGKPLKVGDRVILWHGTFGRTYDGTNISGGFFSFPVAELVPEPQAKK